MNANFTHKTSLLYINIMLALSAMVSTNNAYADCVPNGDGTQTCSGVSSNNDTLFTGPLILNNTGGVTNTINNTTTQSNLITVPGVLDADGNYLINPEYGAIIRSISNTVGASSTIIADGDSPVVINNIGGTIDIITNDAGLGPRTFDPATWTYNETTRELFNNGVKVGYAAAISAAGSTPSLTINNTFVDNRILNPITGFTGLAANIAGSGEFTAGVHTNTNLLTVNNTNYISSLMSFAGASFTAPTILDGTAYATNVSAGTTVINMNSPPLGSNAGGGFGEVYVIDRNPLLTQAQASALTAGNNLVVSYGISDVGPRNSIINVGGGSNIFNLYLGSGSHVLNAANSGGGYGVVNNIFVDQTDAEVIDVVGGVSSTLYKVHGDRTFTYNSSNPLGSGNITINDVEGAVNTLNVSGILTNWFDNITANGLGNNTLNLTCSSNSGAECGYGYLNTVTGMTTINLMGVPSVLAGLYSARDNNNVSGSINLIDTTLSLSDVGVLEATNVVVGKNSLLKAPGVPELKNQTMGIITGNLVNNGSIYIGDATLNVSGNSNMNAGSRLGVGIGPTKNGLLNTAGSSNFASDAIVEVSVKSSVLVRDGQSFTIANNISGLPTIATNNSLLQWRLNDVAGSLVATADVGIPDSLKSIVSPAAQNAAKAFYSYQGPEINTVSLLANLQTVPGEELAPLVERLRPEINDGAIRMVIGNTDKVFGIIDSKLLNTYLVESKLQTTKEQGAAAANDTLKTSKGFWVQGFGDRGTQEAMQGGDGYGVSVAGMAMGMDRSLDSDSRLGFALSYARGNLTNTGNTVNNRIDTNSYLATVYGSHNITDWYISGALGIGRNTYDNRRELFNYTATGTHDSWQFSTRIGAGMPMLIDESLAFIPMVSLDYSHIRESANKENKQERVQLLDYSQIAPFPIYVNGLPQYTNVNSPINLAVASRSFDSIRTGLGAKAIYSFQQPNWSAELELHGMYRHEFGDIAQNSKASFVVGSNSFNSPGVKPIRDDFVLGGSLRLTGDDENDQLTILTSYDANFREKYFGQTMTLNLRYDFDQAPRYLKAAKEKLAKLKAKNAPEQQIVITEQEIAEIQKTMQAELVINATNPIDIEKQKAIDTTINTWANALSNKNLDVYFNTYAANFETPDGSTRQQWERKRKAEISKEPNPAIKISYLRIKPKDDHAVAIFTQHFAAGTQQEAIQKFVDLEFKNGRWLIVGEDSVALLE